MLATLNPLSPQASSATPARIFRKETTCDLGAANNSACFYGCLNKAMAIFLRKSDGSKIKKQMMMLMMMMLK